MHHREAERVMLEPDVDMNKTWRGRIYAWNTPRDLPDRQLIKREKLRDFDLIAGARVDRLSPEWMLTRGINAFNNLFAQRDERRFVSDDDI